MERQFRRRLGGPEEAEDQSSGGPEEAARRRTRAAADQRRRLGRRAEDQSTYRGPAGGWSSRLGGSDFSRWRGRTRPRGRGVASGSSPALPLAGGQGAATGDECSAISRSTTFQGDCHCRDHCVATCRSEGHTAGYCFRDVADPDHRVCMCTAPCPPEPVTTTMTSRGNMV
ncbi:uncharacterized protein [Miscanthus floridulus]|uniref:uncharacterized protein isoform X3 n=1 Tax=Miscanthus floridulus TaxID=154761 RepID=UPI00345A34C7